MKSALVLYVPVLHAGYIKLFEKYRDKTDGLFILSQELLEELGFWGKEIRALSPQTAQEAIASLAIFTSVKLLNKETLLELSDTEIITTDEEISHTLVERYLPHNKAIHDTVFLRWDTKLVKSLSDVKYDATSSDSFDLEMISRAKDEGEESSDWWRHVGCILVRNKMVLLESHNRHVPTEHTPYINGDPRDVIEAGKDNYLASALHAEQGMIAEAARQGVPTEGADIYLNVFPCPVCAKMIAYSGIKRCFFASGSASLDGEQVLKAKGVELIYVPIVSPV